MDHRPPVTTKSFIFVLLDPLLTGENLRSSNAASEQGNVFGLFKSNDENLEFDPLVPGRHVKKVISNRVFKKKKREVIINMVSSNNRLPTTWVRWATLKLDRRWWNSLVIRKISLDKVLFEIITIVLFGMWCMWDKKVIGNIKRWVEKCVYDASEIIFGIISRSKHSH